MSKKYVEGMAPDTWDAIAVAREDEIAAMEVHPGQPVSDEDFLRCLQRQRPRGWTQFWERHRKAARLAEDPERDEDAILIQPAYAKVLAAAIFEAKYRTEPLSTMYSESEAVDAWLVYHPKERGEKTYDDARERAKMWVVGQMKVGAMRWVEYLDARYVSREDLLAHFRKSAGGSRK